MIDTIYTLGPPLLAALFALWAGIVALAAEGDPQLPRVLAAELAERRQALSDARTLHVIHLSLLVLAAAMAAFAAEWWAWPPAWALARLAMLVTLLWIAGDLAPRLLSALAPEVVPLARRLAVPSQVLFRPLLALVAFADRGAEPVAVAPGASPEREMLHGVFALGEMTVAEVMTPRIDIVSVDVADPRDAVIDTFRRARHSRLLVVDDDPDNVLGVLYAKELLGDAEEGEGNWRRLIRPVAFVPEAKTLDRQLRDFQRGPSHLVVVVDEFGGTAGLVTLEDILEQIVGEIQDEYDLEEARPIQAGAPGEWLVQGGVALSELEAELGVEFGREDVNTIGGLILALLGRVPRAGDQVEVAGLLLQVEQVVRRRVRRVSVRSPVRVAEEASE
jgi:CBS domain containing-hemolysin-like protein